MVIFVMTERLDLVLLQSHYENMPMQYKENFLVVKMKVSVENV